MSRRRAMVLALALLAGAALPAWGQKILVVHLPSAPVAAAGDQAEAITAFAEYLAARLPGRDFEPEIFRRWPDVEDYLRQRSADVALMLSDAALAHDRSTGLTPAFRFERGGRSTYRRLLVVRGDRPQIERLVDLRGMSLAVVETSGADAAFLRREVFEDALDPAAWFAAVEPEVDDFSATASVLYGQTDAALVAEYNPLLVSHLGRELRAVFESPELSLPVLSVRESAFAATDLEALGLALEGLAEAPLGLRVLSELGIEAIRPVAGDALVRGPSRKTRTLSIASAAGADAALEALPPPAPELLSFAVAVELLEIPLLLEE